MGRLNWLDVLAISEYSVNPLNFMSWKLKLVHVSSWHICLSTGMPCGQPVRRWSRIPVACSSQTKRWKLLSCSSVLSLRLTANPWSVRGQPNPMVDLQCACIALHPSQSPLHHYATWRSAAHTACRSLVDGPFFGCVPWAVCISGRVPDLYPTPCLRLFLHFLLAAAG